MKSFALAALSASFLLMTGATFADQTIRVLPNQNTVTLELKANPTTGYQWFLENYDPSHLTFLGYHYLAPSSAGQTPKLVGAPGVAVFSFQVKPAFHQGPLLSKIHLVYGQPWNMTATTDTTVTLVSPPPSESADVQTSENMAIPNQTDSKAFSPKPSSDSLNIAEPKGPDLTPPTMSTVQAPTEPSPTAEAEPSPAPQTKQNTPNSADTSWLNLQSSHTSSDA